MTPGINPALPAMSEAEATARALDMTYAAMRKPRIAPAERRVSECCGKPPLDGEIDQGGIARCARCHEWAKFLEVQEAPHGT